MSWDLKFSVMKCMVTQSIKKEATGGLDFVQERTGHYRRSLSHGMSLS